LCLVKFLQGVPQGSILGPLLFSLFINDISNSILFSNYHIFADDAQIYLSGSKKNIASVVSQLNFDLAPISEWSKRNGMCLNSQKTQSMAINRYEPPSLPTVKVDDTIIPYLGVTMDCNLSWKDQISNMVSGVNGALSRL
jgi:Reverse transcriptase (RNA-dependent DNA polymerase)